VVPFKPPMVPDSVSRTAAGALAALSLAFAGCLLQADYSVKITTADGVTLEVPLNKQGEIHASDEVISVRNFQFVPTATEATKALGYLFELEFKEGTRPASIAVDDITEEPIMALMTDGAPKLDKRNRWVASTPGWNPAEERVNWISTLDNGVRVFRFTVKLTGGSVHVLRLPVFVPAWKKAELRTQLGVK